MIFAVVTVIMTVAVAVAVAGGGGGGKDCGGGRQAMIGAAGGVGGLTRAK